MCSCFTWVSMQSHLVMNTIQGALPGTTVKSKNAPQYLYTALFNGQIPMTALSKLAWVCGRPLAGIAGLNPAGVHRCLFLVVVVCCQAEVFATGRQLVQRNPTECVSVCDREASTRLPWSTTGCSALKKSILVH
jgi:hypothetical protein